MVALCRTRSLSLLLAALLAAACAGQEPQLRGGLASGGPFSDKLLLPVLVGAKHGYIDPTGTLAIAPEFDQAADFTEGLALVMSVWTSRSWPPASSATGGGSG